MKRGSEPGITLGSSRHQPLQSHNHRWGDTQHAVPTQPQLRWHRDTHQLRGMPVPSGWPCTLTPTAKVPPGSSCCLSHCCLHLCGSGRTYHLIKQILHLNCSGRAGGGKAMGGTGQGHWFLIPSPRCLPPDATDV